MKQTLEDLKQRIGAIMNHNIATKNRKAGFQIMVVALLLSAFSFFAWYVFKTLFSS